MAFVSVPKDLTKVKNKVVLNLTKRQLICLSAAAAVGLPFYFLTRNYIGISNAAAGMVILMLPAFLFAMYEKDGQPAEKYLRDVIEMRFLRPGIRRYRVENLYEQLKEREKMEMEVETLENKQKEWKERRTRKAAGGK